MELKATLQAKSEAKIFSIELAPWALGPPSVVGSALRASNILVVSSREYSDARCSVV